MNQSEEIKELQERINRLNTEIRNCNHVWGDTKYDPYTIKEPVFSHFIPHGSDPEPVYNYNDKTMPRWSRTCTECGHTEYTEKTEPVVSHHQAKF